MGVVEFQVDDDKRRDTRFLRFDAAPPEKRSVPTIGLIAPSANAMVEAEFHRLIGDATVLVTGRAQMTLGATWADDSEFRAAIEKIHENYEVAYRSFHGQRIDQLVIGDAGFWMPMAGHEALRERLTALTGRVPTLAAFAFLDTLGAMGARKIATITPRQPASGIVSGGIWAENGLTVTGVGDLQCGSADDIASVTPERVMAVAQELARDRPDAICVTGTNIALSMAVPAIRKAVGVPVLHITDLLAADALAALGLTHRTDIADVAVDL